MEYYDRIQNKAWKTIYRVIVSIQRLIGYICAIALPLIITYEVILRYVLKSPLMGIEELMTFFIIWLYMIGGSVASEQRSHIECGILTLYLKKEKTIAIFDVVRSVISMAICAWLLRWAFWYLTYSFGLWKTSDILKIPMFIGECSMFIGFALMFFFGIIELVDRVKLMIAVLKGKGAAE